MSERAELERAIGAIEAQRTTLGDDVVLPLLAAARERLAALDAAAESSATSPEAGRVDRRQVTVLFCELSAEGASAGFVADALARLDRIVVAHGGEIDKHSGSVLMALWGAQRNREDDAARAMACALAVRRSVEDARASAPSALTVRIGINTGSAIVGAVGTVGERSATGDSVNTASRFKDAAAAGEIVVGGTTRDLARADFVLAPLAPLSVKGKQEPLRAYRLVRSGTRSSSAGSRGLDGIEIAMVGRERELQRLREAVGDVIPAGPARVLTIVGEPGVGKSRLLRELAVWIREELGEQVRLLRSRAEPTSTTSPGIVLRRVFEDASGILESDPPAAARRKLQDAFPAGADPTAAQRLHVAAQLIGLDWSESPHVAPFLGTDGGSEQLRESGLRAAASLLRSIGTPVALLLEDLHWGDASSLCGLQRIVDLAPDLPLLVVATSRPLGDDAPPLVARSEIVPLSPLPDHDAHDLVVQLLSQLPQIPPELTQLLVERSEGNPFFVEELVRMLLDDGAIARGDGTWHLVARRLGAERIPATLTGVLQARLDALPTQLQLLLQRAAVIGRRFWVDALVALGEPPEELPVRLEALERREMIFPTVREEREGERIFKHAILRDVAYESMLRKERREAHLRVAHWLETSSGMEPERCAPLAAQHLERGGDEGRAAEQLLVAAKAAAARFANVDALALIDRALQLRGDPELAFDALGVRERVLDTLGRRDDQLRDIEALERLGADGGKREWSVEAALRRAHFAMVTGAYDTASRAAAVARAGAEELEDPRLLVRALHLEARFLLERGHPVEAHSVLTRALELCRRAAEPRLEVGLLLSLGGCCLRQDEAAAARENTEAAAEIARRVADRRSEANCLNLLGALARTTGDREAALSHYEAAVAVAQKAGDRRAASIPMINRAMTMIELGCPDAALELIERFLSIKGEIGDRPGEVWGLVKRGLALHHLGRHEESLAPSRDAIALARELGDRDNETGAWQALGHGLLALGRHDEARDAYARSLEVARWAGKPTLDAKAWLALAAIEVGDLPEARRLVDELQTAPGAETSALCCYAAFRVLGASDDPGAPARLRQAAALVEEEAARIASPALRASYVEGVPLHRAIRDAGALAG